MKKLIVFVLSVFLMAFCFANDTAVVYFDHAHKMTSKKKAITWGKEYKVGNAWALNSYNTDGVVESTTGYLDEDCTIKEGPKMLYNEKGKLLQLITYTDNKLNGPFIYYYESGEKQMDGNYSMDKKTGDWTGYFASGKIAGKAHYEDDNQVSASFLNEDGTARAPLDSFYRPASYTGGDNAWILLLRKNLRYPQEAQDNEVQGRVTIRFTVKADGRLDNFAIDWSMQPYLEQESLRVVKMMPDWIPAIIGGQHIEIQMKKTITFRLETR